jgi:hypothetical protein
MEREWLLFYVINLVLGVASAVIVPRVIPPDAALDCRGVQTNAAHARQRRRRPWAQTSISTSKPP